MIVLTGVKAPFELTQHAIPIKQQGIDFAIRYYSHQAGKNLSLAEARALYAGRYEELRFGKAGVALTIKGRSGADRDFGVRIESTDGQKVTSISSGHLAALAAPDGCA